MRFAGDQMPWRNYGAPVSSGGFKKKAVAAGMDPAAYARYILKKESRGVGEVPDSLLEAARFAENDISWELPGLSG